MVAPVSSIEVPLTGVAESYARCMRATVFAPAVHNAVGLRDLEGQLLPGCSLSDTLSRLALAEAANGYVPTQLDPNAWGSESIAKDEGSVAGRRLAAVAVLTELAVQLAPSGRLHPSQALEVYETLAGTIRTMCGRDDEGTRQTQRVLHDIRLGLVQASAGLAGSGNAVGQYGPLAARNAIERVWPAIGGRDFHFVPQPRPASPQS